MKRRSARPFMVEVKHARTSRTALKAPESQARPDKVLWPELAQALAQAEPKPVQHAFEAAPAPRAEPKEPDAPVRRVLPSLVPMFQGADEPEVEAEPQPEAPPRRTRRKRAPVAAQPAREATPAEPAPEIRPAAPRPAPMAAKPTAAAPVEPRPGAASRPATWRRTKELPLGERWKRRLPPYLR
ncbi:hypothetical protein MKK88_08315 [Methylobacterium sp. E-005]|uniref:hypothetical protein n=1 Tax=Methylobacterium sp. E-005 TaxID=2836549 RepID=UPI001FBA8B98|nr:hypothetical protein [Methylobacterium sp. E-005]MCJ2085999.1 hypothetical protein [Methylobacterium sp. E-005]